MDVEMAAVVDVAGRRREVAKVESDSAMGRLEGTAEAVVVAATELLPGAVAKAVGRVEVGIVEVRVASDDTRDGARPFELLRSSIVSSLPFSTFRAVNTHS